MACRITFGSTSSSPSHGLVSNSRAPPFIAFTVMDISQWPERKVIGTLLRSAARRSGSSRPFRSGGDTSRMRHHGTADRGRARNSCADANVQGMDQYLRPTHSFFSYGLIATIVPSEGNLATDSSSEGSSQLTRVPNEDPP